MGRPRKQILSNETYEICMRTRRGLPFVCTFYMQLILEGVLARVQRNMKVVINHFLWMANHAHIIVEAKDAEECTRFYGEVQKQLTEALKRLLGRKHLSLWRSNETSVLHLGDKAAVMKQIAYLYANPARANLVETIDDYPGVSSWRDFAAATADIRATVSKSCPWIQAPMIPTLPTRSVNSRQDMRLTAMMRERKRQSHDLVLHPNRWMKKYGIVSSEDVAATNRSIMEMVRENERRARIQRQVDGKKVMGANRLRRRELTLDYVPRKLTRRLFVYAEDKQLRIRMIEAYRAFCEACRRCYEQWKRGIFAVDWPPGALKPPQPINANWFGP